MERCRRLLRAGLEGDREAVREAAIEIGFLREETAPHHQEVVVGVIARVFQTIAREHRFDFGRSDLVAEIIGTGRALAVARTFVEVPPIDVLHVQRKVAGIYLIAGSLARGFPSASCCWSMPRRLRTRPWARLSEPRKDVLSRRLVPD